VNKWSIFFIIKFLRSELKSCVSRHIIICCQAKHTSLEHVFALRDNATLLLDDYCLSVFEVLRCVDEYSRA